MPCVILLLSAIHRPKSPIPFDVVRYSLLKLQGLPFQTPTKRENCGGLSRNKFIVSVVSFFHVQLSDNISEIWSPIILQFRGEITIRQVFDENIYFFLGKDSKVHALAKTCWQASIGQLNKMKERLKLL